MMRAAVIAVAALGALAQAASAQDRSSPQARDFVEAAASSDTFELMEAYTALAQSKDARVIAFARQMIRDHGRTSQTLSSAARKAGLEAPTMQVGSAQTPLLAALQSARGPEFDKTYWQQQTLAHRSALVTEQQYAETGDVPALRQAAADAIPIIKDHLAMAELMSVREGS